MVAMSPDKLVCLQVKCLHMHWARLHLPSSQSTCGPVTHTQFTLEREGTFNNATRHLLPSFHPSNSTAIPESILPCDDGKLAEAAGELKSANPPNGSLDPPRNRGKAKLLQDCAKIHCNNCMWDLWRKAVLHLTRWIYWFCSLSQLCFPAHAQTMFIQAWATINWTISNCLADLAALFSMGRTKT